MKAITLSDKNWSVVCKQVETCMNVETDKAKATLNGRNAQQYYADKARLLKSILESIREQRKVK